jgi:hypothetical protein
MTLNANIKDLLPKNPVLAMALDEEELAEV